MSGDPVKRIAEQMAEAAATEPKDDPYALTFVSHEQLGAAGLAVRKARDVFLRQFQHAAEQVGPAHALSGLTTALVDCLHALTEPAFAASVLRQLADTYPQLRREFDAAARRRMH